MPVERPVVVVSNRGPVSFALAPDGSPVPRRGAGGLVSGLGPLVRNTDTIWIAAAMTEGDRAVAGSLIDAEGFRVRLLDVEPDLYATYYDSVCNTALWFTHHGLFDPVYEPAWPADWVHDVWSSYRTVNARFADAVIETAPEGAIVLVQDYHLAMVAEPVALSRPDVTLVHFSHTPFAPPEWLRMLPIEARSQLLSGLAAHHACGFHSRRWEADFRECMEDAGIDAPNTFVAPLGPDAEDLRTTLSSAACIAAAEELDAEVGDRKFLVRVDRIELSKNVLRGFEAFAALLGRRPDLVGQVVFGAYLYPSRAGVPDYDRYRRAAVAVVERINEAFGTPDWTPIIFDQEDDYPRSMAALARADVVLVNPIRDGLNLVAKEAMLVNDRDGQLVLSPEAGAWDELAEFAWRADPFDLDQTATALESALDAAPVERRRRHQGLRRAVEARTPADWLADQIHAAD